MNAARVLATLLLLASALPALTNTITNIGWSVNLPDDCVWEGVAPFCQGECTSKFPYELAKGDGGLEEINGSQCWGSFKKVFCAQSAKKYTNCVWEYKNCPWHPNWKIVYDPTYCDFKCGDPSKSVITLDGRLERGAFAGGKAGSTTVWQKYNQLCCTVAR